MKRLTTVVCLSLLVIGLVAAVSFNSALAAAKAMAKARQVGTPHWPQLVLGSILKISIPVNAIIGLLSP